MLSQFRTTLLALPWLVLSACSVYDESLLKQSAPVQDDGDAQEDASPDDDVTESGNGSDDDVDAEGADADAGMPESGLSDVRSDAADVIDGAKADRSDGAAEAAIFDAVDATAGDASVDGDARATAPSDASDCGAPAGQTACAPTCTDGVRNGNEVAVDCGGSCPACSNGSPCTVGASCKSGYCRAQVCAQDSAVSFAGTQTIAMRRTVADDFTIELWMRSTQVTTTGTRWWNGTFLFSADLTGNYDDYGMSLLAGKLAFGTGYPDATIISAASINSGAWTHVAATRTRATGALSLFVNGVLEAQGTGSTASLDAATTAYIGGDDVHAHGYAGDVDEIRVWSVVRTAAEISANMRKRLTGTEARLVGYWRLDDKAGRTFVDSSPSGNDGTWTVATEPTWIVSSVPMTPNP